MKTPEDRHEIRNVLQTVMSLLNLQARTLQDDQLLKQFDKFRNRVYAVALADDFLAHSTENGKGRISVFLQKLFGHLLQSYDIRRRVTLEISDTDFSVQPGQHIPIGLILHELIANAIEHGFPSERTGVVSVTVRADEQLILLQVSDTGIGLPTNFRPDDQPSLGLQLVQQLCSQLHGTYKLFNRSGTAVEIRYPVSGFDKIPIDLQR